YVLPGTVVCSFFGGPIIDLFSWLLGGVITPDSGMVLRFLSMLAGCVVLAAGMSLVIKSDAGTGANDLVAVILTDKLGRFQFRWVRVACDVFFAVTGFLLGGVLGIGSVAAACLVGPVAQFFFPFMERLVHRVVGVACPEGRNGG
ncbi:MAG: YitT family protein, partial [Planctomycetaceae bacterium]|nr:YitT family protein [Planctomycetaceae bacterium]